MTPPNQIQYATKDQLERALKEWVVTDPIPKKGKALTIAFPPPAVLNLVTVTVHNKKSTYGKTLYKIEFQKA